MEVACEAPLMLEVAAAGRRTFHQCSARSDIADCRRHDVLFWYLAINHKE